MSEKNNDALAALDNELAKTASTYAATPDGFLLRIPGKPPRDERLTNFLARITADVVVDDGVEQKRRYELETVWAGVTSNASIDADEYNDLKWLDRVGGPELIVYPLTKASLHAAVAIREHSQPVPDRHVYTSTGWRKSGDEHYYCHAGGGIGSEGNVDSIQTEFSGALERYRLPLPPTGEALQAAVQASLKLLKVAPSEITFPMFAAIWRGALCATDFAIFAVGPTGVFKSEMAALIQQHYGAEMSRVCLPGSWSSTDNALEGMLFQTADAIVVVDDFKPAGSANDVARIQARAERIFRSIGNGSARQRMNSSADLRPPKPPRGLCLVTGEALPAGHSLRARLLILHIERGAIESRKLTACQQDARDGKYALALSAFLRWLAGQRDEVLEKKPARIREWRKKFGSSDSHRRTAPMAAELMYGMELFTDFAKAHGVLSEKKAADLLRECRRALRRCADRQLKFQQTQEPGERFLRLVEEALASGAAHLCGPDNEEPYCKNVSQACGWRLHDLTRVPRGAHIGWIQGTTVRLIPTLAIRCAREIAGPIDPFSSSEHEILTALANGKKLLRAGKNRHRAQFKVQGKRRYVVEIDGREIGIPFPIPHNMPLPEDDD